ncbi:probable WRKY transcription factor 19 [Juglans microcarpa x Juglans regia]|uniref:probable WRKY transcription factor 19 n=1 Tax=Juglans microcarpa x Juglans regia TaxID=2249226 RepID=UPI001B7ED173|nr:probable WRKY transcription factor 19 [Juglans microcarpa x Juglans regia]
MHDLLQEMGKEIVRQESPKEAGKRSRLWFYEDVRHVLEENTGTNTIEAILLDFPKDDDDMQIRLHSEAFMNMKNLRLLFINWNIVQFSGGPPNYLPNKIRVPDWPEYPWSILPSNFHGNKLVEFQMPFSLIKELGVLKSKNLTVMNLSECQFLTKIYDLSSCRNLENLDLGDCENLVEVHDSVGFLDTLSSFLVSGCCKLRILLKRFKLRSLCFFNLYDCSSLKDFPKIECEMEFLHVLDFGGTSIRELPSSIENLTQLQELYAIDCKNLRHLPSSIFQLQSLRIVKVKDGIQCTRVE